MHVIWCHFSSTPAPALLLTAAKSYLCCENSANVNQIFQKIGGCKHMHMHPIETEEGTTG